MTPARSTFASLLLAALFVSTSGCISSQWVVSGIESSRPTRHFEGRIDQVTLARSAEGLVPHVGVRLEDGRTIHYAFETPGRFAIDEGPLPPSVVPVIVMERPDSVVLAPGDIVWHTNPVDGTLSGPERATDKDLEAYVVLISGCDCDHSLAVKITTVRFGLQAPARDHDWLSPVLELDDSMAWIVAASIEERGTRLVPHLTVERNDRRREHLESGDLRTLTPSLVEFPTPTIPLRFVRNIDPLDIRRGGWPVGEDESASRSLFGSTGSEQREAAVYEVLVEGRWRVRFFMPRGERVADSRFRVFSLTPYEEFSFWQTVRVAALGALLPVTLALDFVTSPIQLFVGIIFFVVGSHSIPV